MAAACVGAGALQARLRRAKAGSAFTPHTGPLRPVNDHNSPNSCLSPGLAGKGPRPASQWGSQAVARPRLEGPGGLLLYLAGPCHIHSGRVRVLQTNPILSSQPPSPHPLYIKKQAQRGLVTCWRPYSLSGEEPGGESELLNRVLPHPLLILPSLQQKGSLLWAEPQG